MKSRVSDPSRVRRFRPAFLPVVVLAVLLAALQGVATAAELRHPADPTEILERLPSAARWRDPERAALLAAVAREPGALDPAVALARLDVSRGRALQDARSMGWAQAVLAPWWNDPLRPVPVRLLRADILQHRHAFNEALTELDGALALDAAHPAALVGRAQLLMVLGRAPEAREPCEALIRRVTPIVASVCLGTVRWLTGDAAGGEALIARTLARRPPSDPVLAAWALAALAETAQAQGNAAAARLALEQALASTPDDLGLVNSLADLLLAQGDAEAALTLLEATDGNDGALLRRAVALRRLGRPDPILVDQLAQRFASAAARGETVASREEARFLLEVADDRMRALAAARANWTTQREVEDARLLLAAAAAAGDPDAAEPVRAWIAATGIKDFRLDRRAAGPGA